MAARRTLSRADVRAVYDRMGRWQETQAFYSTPAYEALLANASFETAHTLLEIGCGTGRFAERVLRTQGPPDAQYLGVDLSSTMVRQARARLSSFGERVTVVQTDGDCSFDGPDGYWDCVIGTYVLDLLPAADIRRFLAEAHRLLGAGGQLCLAGLTWGDDALGRLVARGWAALHTVWPSVVGGCRPLRMSRFLKRERWQVVHHETVRAWGVPSEVVVAEPEG